MYTVVISRTSERVAIEDIENLKKRLRKAKQIELDSIFSGAFLMRRDHSDRSASIVHGNSVDILTLVGADAAKEGMRRGWIHLAAGAVAKSVRGVAGGVRKKRRVGRLGRRRRRRARGIVSGRVHRENGEEFGVLV